MCECVCVCTCVLFLIEKQHIFFVLILPLSVREIENGWRERECGGGRELVPYDTQLYDSGVSPTSLFSKTLFLSGWLASV